MHRAARAPLWLCILLLVAGSVSVGAAEIRVAVASNVAGAARVLVERFEAATEHSVILATGSTGKHYAQIRNGAPFQAFLAADVERPRKLEDQGIAVAGSRFTYAQGALVLWSPEAGYVDPKGRVLETGDYRHLALANPRLAPYGRAARQVLEARGLWAVTKGRRVMGENIAQAFHFVQTGNAQLGFVAASQLKAMGSSAGGSQWRVPESFHEPIEQQAVLLQENQAARAFLSFIASDKGRAVLRDFGYEVP
ncbi:molybdate ABC transporter substrate-binding protein [Halomonadaceae bacterium KBTZ08]